MKKVLPVILLIFFFTSCSSEPEFSEVEKRQANLFIEALLLDIESVKISNARKAYSESTDADMKRILNLKIEALSKAEKIPESVLLKMNKDLPEQYAKYKKGLSMRIDNLKNRNINAEMEGSRLIDEWTDWYEENMEKIKIPQQ